MGRQTIDQMSVEANGKRNCVGETSVKPQPSAAATPPSPSRPPKSASTLSNTSNRRTGQGQHGDGYGQPAQLQGDGPPAVPARRGARHQRPRSAPSTFHPKIHTVCRVRHLVNGSGAITSRSTRGHSASALYRWCVMPSANLQRPIPAPRRFHSDDRAIHRGYRNGDEGGRRASGVLDRPFGRHAACRQHVGRLPDLDR